MVVKAEAIKETEVVSNERRESKPIRLLRLIRDSLLKDEPALLAEYKIELIKLSKEAGLKDTEIGPFLTSVTGLIIRTSHAGKIKGQAEFQFDSGYTSVSEVIKGIDTYLPRRVIPIIRTRKSEYRD